MKKYLSLLLVGAMLLMIMAGCTTTNDEGSPSPSPTATEEASPSPSPSVSPSEEASASEEPTASESDVLRWTGGVVGNGEEVVAIVPTLNVESIIEWSDVWAEEMEAAGYSASVQSAEENVSNYVTLIEDYTEKGVVGMFIAPMDTDAIQDAVQTAMDKGIVIIFLGADSDNYDPDGGVMTDYYWTGYGAVELAVDWLKNEATIDTSEPVPVAINTYYDNVNGARRSEGYKEAIDENSDLLSLGYEEAFNTSIDGGYNFAETALTVNPDIRIFVGYEADTAQGVNSYLMDEYLPAHPELSIDDFLVVSAYYDEAAVATLDEAEADPSSSTFKAYITYGAGNVETGYSLAYIHLSLLSGQAEAPYWYYDSVSSRTTWNGTGVYERITDMS